MMRVIEQLDEALRAAVRWVSAALLLAVTTLGVAQVVARYGLNSSIVWSEEAIRLLYVWMVLVAATAAPHMRVGLLADAASGALDLVLRLVRIAIVTALLAILIHGALTLQATFGTDRYVTLGITKAWYWSAAIVCGILWMVLTYTALVRRAGPDGASRP